MYPLGPPLSETLYCLPACSVYVVPGDSAPAALPVPVPPLFDATVRFHGTRRRVAAVVVDTCLITVSVASRYREVSSRRARFAALTPVSSTQLFVVSRLVWPLSVQVVPPSRCHSSSEPSLFPFSSLSR